MSETETRELLSASAVSRRLGLSAPTVLKLAREGTIPVAIQVGKIWRFDWRHVNEALDAETKRQTKARRAADDRGAA